LLAVVYDVQNTTKTHIQASLPVWRGYTHLRTSDFWVEKFSISADRINAAQ